uniref:CSON007840 protein n=1 Tax=Culicoides sonorensis TaxID=179676 RepID=A0A336MXJ9_CULSO
MELLCHELQIPKRYIKEETGNRFQVRAHKSWIKQLGQYGKVGSFTDNNSNSNWQQIFITVYQKHTHKVIPLPRLKHHDESNAAIADQLPITYSQLISYVSQNNHKSLWKSAYQKYSASRQCVTVSSTTTTTTTNSTLEQIAQQQSTKITSNTSTRNHESFSNSINLLPYDIVLREAIVRMYKCRIVQFRNWKSDDSASFNEDIQDSLSDDSHPNLYPVLVAIETNSCFFIVHNAQIDHTLLDCVTFSPAILDDYNKSLFLVYQLLTLIKNLHANGLLLGEINLSDIYLTENLWLQVFPQIEANLVEHQDDVSSSHEYISFKMMDEPPITYTLKDYCEMWVYGHLSNFDYLTILNNFAGRRIDSAGYHHIFPWVTDFTSRNGQVWRDLTKSKYRLNKGETQLDITFQPSLTNTPHHVSDVLSEITYYVYMARRTPKNVLCKHVRPVWVPGEYPASIQRLQEWTPDECIPEFFTDPQVFKSIHEDLPDLMLPTWSTCPEDFVNKHREALESQYVSEKLHHWIDLTFGYKLSGSAAIKAKNVCLPLIDKHKNLSKRGIVQLFYSHHPAKQFPNVWTQKVPPRIRSHSETRQRRMTRSSEDLSRNSDAISTISEPNNSPTRLRRSNVPQSESIERSPSCYHVSSGVAGSNRDTITLPKNYNPLSQLSALENLHSFKGKTFLETSPLTQIDFISCGVKNMTTTTGNSVKSFQNSQKNLKYEEEGNSYGFTNRIFSEAFEAQAANTAKESKMLMNLKQKRQLQKQAKKNMKQITAENRAKDLQILGILILEIFLPGKMRAHGSCSKMSVDQRIAVCENIMKNEIKLIPGCVLYPLQLLFGLSNDVDGKEVTDKGLPIPNAEQLLEPILSNTLFPFPVHYFKVYSIMKMLYNFNNVGKMLELYTFFECDGKQCAKFETLDKTRIAFSRKLAECKVKSSVNLIESLLQPVGHEQFSPVKLLLPHVIDLIVDDETSILAAWYLFDTVATALGPQESQKYLLGPILSLYEAESDDRTVFLQSNDISMRFSTTNTFKSRKAVKLYHHSFLLKLIVRFGLKCFLENFVPPLIEAVGGYKDPQINQPYHVHSIRNSEIRQSRSITKNLKFAETATDLSETTLMSPTDDNSIEDKTLSPVSTTPQMNQPATGEDVFVFEPESPGNPNDEGENSNNAIQKILDQLDIKSESGSFDLKLNYSTAFEVTEDEPLCPDALSHDSYELDDSAHGQTQFTIGSGDIQSPTIPIPSSFHRTIELNSIGCEIGSKRSIDSIDIFSANLTNKENNKVDTGKNNDTITVQASNDDNAGDTGNGTTTMTSSIFTVRSMADSRATSRSMRIADMSSESLLWLSHRLGPVLTARYLTRNLLKMLTLCYVGHENLLPEETSPPSPTDDQTITTFTISDARIVGDKAATNVLDCLTMMAALFGEQFILLQYFPHLSELIALCRKRITPSLEGGLISALQMLKHLIPCLSDSQLMEQLQDTILQNIIHPIIRLVSSSRTTMPSGFLARSVLTRKLLDVLYAIAVRIGPEMTNKQLCVPALQRFFLIFDKAYGVYDSNQKEKVASDTNWISQDDIPSYPSTLLEETQLLEIRRDGKIKEWCVKGAEIHSANAQRDDSFSNLTPPPAQPQSNAEQSSSSFDVNEVREKALDEIRDVFTPHLAYCAYMPFLKYLGEFIMGKTVVNHQLIMSLCLEHEQPDYSIMKNDIHKFESTAINQSALSMDSQLDYEQQLGNSFGSNVAVVGNRIDVQFGGQGPDRTEMGIGDVINMVAYKFDNLNTSRHLKGNWLAYWEHEIGRSDKDSRFNIKQIKLQTYTGHVNSVRAIVCLDNENSFMSASKDKTVKLWSLRSEGDGSKVSTCQFTYTNHKKSVHSLAFLESLRLTVSCDSGVHIWDPFVGASVGYFDAPRYSPVTVVRTFPSPSSIVIAGTSESTLKMIDARTFNYVNEWKLTPIINGQVRSIAVAPSGNYIAAGLSSGQIVLLDGRTGYVISSWRASDSELLQLVSANEQQLVSSCLDHSISVWNTKDGSLMHHLRSPPEPAHCLVTNGSELMLGTPANRIGNYSTINPDGAYAFTKLRSEIFRGVLTSLSILPLNRMVLVGSDNGNINLLC